MLSAMNDLVIFISKYFILIPVLVTAYVFFKLKSTNRREMLVLLFCVGALSIILAKIGAHAYTNTRPYLTDGTPSLFPHSGDPNGFPSDHTLLSSFLAFVVFTYSRKLGVVLLVVAVLIGWARVAAHVHHAVDIIGSFAITGAAYLIVCKILENKKVAERLNIKRGNLLKENS
jgi:membrane-associated phospholipid phosphatase